MSAYDLIVVDEAHTVAGPTLHELCNMLDKEISQYIKILEQITADAAKAGRTTTRYQEYAGLVSGLQGQLANVGKTLNSIATEFVAQIDKADSYLY